MLRRISTMMFSLAMIAVVSVVAGCGDDTGPQDGTARLTVALTDAPDPMFAEASVEIGAVSLIPADGPPIVLADAGGTHDLLMLQNGVMVNLATQEIEAGRYLQLRLEVLSATVTLAEGLTWSDGTSDQRSLFVPSGAQSGIKVNLRNADGPAGVDIASGETILVVDMDVSQNFKIQGSVGTPAGIRDVKFTPLLRATLMDVAGSISGTVSYPSATPADETEFATITADQDVTATSPLIEEMQTMMVTTVTGSDSTYTLWFVAPGTYDVSAAATIGAVEFTDGPQSVSVSDGENVTGIDFSL